MINLIRNPRSTNALGVDNVIATLGNFDGLHVGHKVIFEKISDLKFEHKNKGDVCSCVISFYPHPAKVLGKAEEVRRLTLLREQLDMLRGWDVDYVVLFRFDSKFMEQTAEQFVAEILFKTLNVSHLVIGSDARVGKGGKGTAKVLSGLFSKAKRSLTTIELSKQNEQKIGSAQIRSILEAGDICTANELLGYDYSLYSRVLHGEGRGAGLGVPTANFVITKQAVPNNGVYITSAIYNDISYPAVTNIGVRPTFGYGKRLVETYILGGFERSIYGERLKVVFHKRIRAEKKFDSIEELKKQINSDTKEAIEYHRSK